MPHYRKFFDEKYIGAWDIDDAGRDFTLTIKSVEIEKLRNNDSGKDESKMMISFKEAKKGMICNKTNARTIASLYGNETNDWRGKKITLTTEDVRAFGQIFRSIRVVAEKPTTAPTRAPASLSESHDPDTGEVREPGDDDDEPISARVQRMAPEDPPR